MRRPSKKKLEVVETTAEDGAEVDCDTGVTGAEDEALDDATQDDMTVDPMAGPDGKKWKAALDAWEAASKTAIWKRAVANKFVQKEKLAVRIFDAKWRRLENGDKRKRKSTFGAARRSYEAIIARNEAQYMCAVARCDAAEAERDAAMAEVKLAELQ